MEITVIKRDGSKQPFDTDKIIKVVQAAGLRPIDAEDLAKKVTNAVEKRGKDSIKSIEVRDIVFKELEKVDSYASGLYAWYQSTKEK